MTWLNTEPFLRYDFAEGQLDWMPTWPVGAFKPTKENARSARGLRSRYCVMLFTPPRFRWASAADPLRTPAKIAHGAILLRDSQEKGALIGQYLLIKDPVLWNGASAKWNCAWTRTSVNTRPAQKTLTAPADRPAPRWCKCALTKLLNRSSEKKNPKCTATMPLQLTVSQTLKDEATKIYRPSDIYISKFIKSAQWCGHQNNCKQKPANCTKVITQVNPLQNQHVQRLQSAEDTYWILHWIFLFLLWEKTS